MQRGASSHLGVPALGPASATARPTAGATLLEVLGIGSDGLLLIDPSAGKTVPTLPAVFPSGEQLSVTADGSTLYYEQAAPCTDQIYAIPTS